MRTLWLRPLRTVLGVGAQVWGGGGQRTSTPPASLQAAQRAALPGGLGWRLQARCTPCPLACALLLLLPMMQPCLMCPWPPWAAQTA